jgi:hypothetical protein
MSVDLSVPARGTPEYDWWMKGATAENHYQYKGMQDESRELFECVRTMAQQGDSPDRLTWFTAVVFTCEWSWHKRLRLAWNILNRKRIRRWISAKRYWRAQRKKDRK